MGSSLSSTDNSLSCAVHSTGARGILVHVATIVIFALSLGSVEAFLGSQVADGLEKTALANLARGQVVDAVLEGVYLLDASDLGLVEIFYKVLVLIGRSKGKRRTLGGIAGLVVLCEPAEVDVLEPRNPLLVLRVICLLCVLHDEY